MGNSISIALLVVGAILLGMGIDASEALASEASESVNRSPTDMAFWLLMAGAAALNFGGLGLFRGAQKLTESGVPLTSASRG